MTRPTSVLTTIDAYKVHVITDNRTTVQAEVVVDGPAGPIALGWGRSRRRPGDRWDQQIGEILAVTRAFDDAARLGRTQLDALGFGDLDAEFVYAAPVKPPYFELVADTPGFTEIDSEFFYRPELDEKEAAEDAAERQYLADHDRRHTAEEQPVKRRWFGRRAAGAGGRS